MEQQDPFRTQPGFLEQFRAGEEAALSAVYRYFSKPVRGFLQRGFSLNGDKTRFVGGRIAHHDLEDVVQETFRKAFGQRARATYDGVRPYRNYLFTIARNVLITDHVVRRRLVPVGAYLTGSEPASTTEFSGPLLSQLRLAQQDADEANESEHRLESLEIYGLLRSYIETLDPELQSFFELRFLNRLSQEATAKAMGWNRARVRKFEARIQRDLVQQFSGSGYLGCDGSTTPKSVVSELGRRRARARHHYRSHRAAPSTDLIFESAALVAAAP